MIVERLATGRRDHQQTRGRGDAQQIVEELQRLEIGAMDVVGHEQDRLHRRENGTRRDVEQPPPQRAFGNRFAD
jgi:hypothetical protein